MRVHRIHLSESNEPLFELIDESGQPIPVVSSFLRHLRARGYSPNTLSAYAYDLLHFLTFLDEQQIAYQEFTPARSLLFLEYLFTRPSKRQAQRLALVLCTTDQGSPATRLAPATINRIFAAVSSFYEFLIVSEQFPYQENPILKVDDPAYARVSDRHRPFMGRAARQRPVRRTVHVKTVQRVPRPMTDEQVSQLLTSLRLKRPNAMLLPLLPSVLRQADLPNLRLEAVSYARRRATIRYRTDHPHGVRTTSRTHPLVYLHHPAPPH